jgi:thiol:disulfide interchange protein
MGENEDIKKFAETYKITFPVGKDRELAKKFGVIGLPVTVFIAKDGRIAKKHFGLITREELNSNINAILK